MSNDFGGGTHLTLLAEEVLNGLTCPRNVLIRVSCRDKTCLELRWREVNAVLQKEVEQAPKSPRIGLLRRFEISHWTRLQEVREHGSNAIDRNSFGRVGGEFRSAKAELIVNFRVGFEVLQHGDPGRNREWVAREGSRLVNGADRRDFLHDVSAPAIRCNREPATDDLA